MESAGLAVRGFTLYAVLLLGSTAASASEIEIKVGDCSTGIELVARNAPLSKVLDRLAETLPFRLHAEGPADRIVSVSMSGPGPELIAALLSPHQRFMMTTASDQRCPGQTRVARVWLLPEGKHATAARQEPLPKRAPVTATATPEQLRVAEEKSRQLKQEYDAYVRRHGKPPPGEEEEAARP